MTRDEILNMPAGEAMDKLIAHKIMGYINGRKDYKYTDGSGDWWTTHIQHYSTDIKAAWDVVEYIAKNKMPIYLVIAVGDDLQGKYIVQFNHHYTPDYLPWKIEADTAPLAICRAALLAIML